MKGVVTPIEADGNYMIYNQYTIQTEKRTELMAHLNEHNVGNAIYYPVPLHLQVLFEYLGYKVGDLPVSERVANEVVSIPVYSELTQGHLQYVVDTLNAF